MSIFKKNNLRTNVFYDFSIVKKAYFYVLEADPDSASSFKYKLRDENAVLPVQINPDNINLEQSAKFNPWNDLRHSSNDPFRHRGSMERSTSSLRLELYFDVYDEHVIRNGGMVGLASRSIKNLSDSNISLMNDKITSLPHLVQCVANKEYSLLFTWGEMSYFGRLTDLTCNYTAFSRWGEPLKCRADVTLAQEEISDTSTNLITQFKSLAGSKKALDRSSRTASKLGTAVSVISGAFR